MTALISLLACLTLLFVAPWYYGLTALQDQLKTQVAIFSFLILIALALRFESKARSFELTVIDKILITSVLLTAIFVVYSVLPFYSLATWFRFLSILGVYVIARRALKFRGSHRWLLASMLVMGVLYSFYGMLQYYFDYFPKDYWYSKSSLASRYVNSGHFAGLLIFPIFAGFMLLLQTHKVWARVTIILSLAFLAAALVLTRSRTVWICVAGGCGLSLVLLGYYKVIGKRAIVAVLILLALGGCAAHALGLTHTLVQRFAEIWDGQHTNLFSIEHRFKFWEGALSAISERPLGWGLGCFVHIFPAFRIHADRFIVDYAHNETMQLGVDLGLAGVIAIYGLWVLYSIQTFVFLRKSSIDLKTKGCVLLALVCMWVLLGASQFDFPMRIYANALFAMMMLAYQAEMIAGYGPEDPEKQTRRRNSFLGLARWGVVVLSFAGVFFSGQYYRAEAAMHRGMSLEKDFEWDLAMDQYHEAMRLGRWQSDYPEAAGRLADKRFALSMSRDAKKTWAEQALSYYSESVKRHPYWPASYYQSAYYHLSLGQDDEAGQAYQKAHELEPQNALYLSEWAFFCLEKGQVEKSIDLLEQLAKLRFSESVHLTTGQILEKVYRHTTNLSHLMRVIPSGWSVQYQLGLFLGSKGRWDEALEVIRPAIRTAEKSMERDYFMNHLGRGIAELYLEHGGCDEAIRLYQDAARAVPENAKYKQKEDELRKQCAANSMAASRLAA